MVISLSFSFEQRILPFYGTNNKYIFFKSKAFLFSFGDHFLDLRVTIISVLLTSDICIRRGKRPWFWQRA